MPDVTLEINEAVPIVLNFGHGAVLATLDNILALLDDLPEYQSDEDAGAVVGLYGWYKTSDNHDSLPGGVPKQVRYL